MTRRQARELMTDSEYERYISEELHTMKVIKKIEEDQDPGNKSHIIGNINLKKQNKLYSDYKLSQKTIINHKDMTIHYELYIDDIMIGIIIRNSEYQRLEFSFIPKYDCLSKFTEQNIEKLKTRVKEQISFIIKFVELFN